MIFIALKNLFQEKTRLFISIGGVAFSVLLILILQGLYQGWQNRMGEYIRNLPADLWVGQEGSRDMSHSVSILAEADKEKIENIDGVVGVATFSGRQMKLNINGKEAVAFVVGYDTASGFGGPLRVIEGKPVPVQGEIIIDRVFAKNKTIKIGDQLPIGSEDFKVVGVSEGGNLVLYQYSFITKEDAENLFKLKGVTNYFLVKVADKNKQGEIASQIEKEIAGSKVYTRAEFVDNNTEIIRETFLPIIFVLVLIGFAVGIAVIGLTIFTSTIEKSREYGVLKAIGVKNGQLYLIVLEQALVSGAIGYVFGLIIALVLNSFVGEIVPEFITFFRMIDLAWIFAAAIFMSIIAAFIPIRRIASINPAEAFKA